MTTDDDRSIRDVLKSAVVGAMKTRDRATVAVYRTALAAIDNAEAVPLDPDQHAGAIEDSVVGVGRTDVPRRQLSEGRMIGIVLREASERRAAAESLAGARPDVAQRLHLDASLLETLVAGAQPTHPVANHLTDR